MPAGVNLAIADAPGGERSLDWEQVRHILSHVRDIVIVLSRNRMLRYANPAAERLLARQDPLRIHKGRLVAVSSAQATKLERAIDAACMFGLTKDEILVLPRTDAPPLVLSLRCMDDTIGDSILLVGSDLQVEAALILNSLRRCFGLTITEAQVAVAVAAGASSANIAAVRGVRVNTIRSQIKSVAAKLGCTTQSQIAAIVRSVPLSANPETGPLRIHPPSG